MKTVGQILLSSALPEDMKHYALQPIDKGRNKKLFTELAQKHPEKYADVLYDLGILSSQAAYFTGGETSPGLKDLRTPLKVAEVIASMRKHVDSIVQKDISGEEKKRQIVKYIRERSDDLRNMVLEEGEKEGNMFAISAAEGFRGNPVQVTQLLAGDLLNVDNSGNPVPVAGLHGYGEGITPEEQLAGAYGAMKGFANVQFLTAKSGYLGKQLSQAASHVKITGEDCGGEGTGIPTTSDDPSVIGKVLSAPVGDLKAGTVLGEDTLASLKHKDIIVRNPNTCQQRFGVCRVCAGKNDKGRFPPIGDYVGLKAADSLSEPMTQVFSLGAKHVGGTVGSHVTALSPFDDVNQVFQATSSFKGAVLSSKTGQVQKIETPPQGGTNIVIDGETIYIPPELEVSIKKGDKVEAGDALTEGPLNPKDLAKYKGLGEARRLFAKQLKDTFKRHGVSPSSQNIDFQTKGFLSHIQVTGSEGAAGYAPGKIVNYAEFQDRYEPREGSRSEVPSRAIGAYLERPVLHFTIGTPITPRVAQIIEKYNIRDIVINEKEPVFEAYIKSPVSMSGTSDDWKERMGGFKIRNSFLEAARTGSTSPRVSKGYIPELMDPVKMYNRLKNPDHFTASEEMASLLNAG